nr:uncharacterized protein LOC120969378 [Aegilops tauschii subsp. strangulata]
MAGARTCRAWPGRSSPAPASAWPAPVSLLWRPSVAASSSFISRSPAKPSFLETSQPRPQSDQRLSGPGRSSPAPASAWPGMHGQQQPDGRARHDGPGRHDTAPRSSRRCRTRRRGRGGARRGRSLHRHSMSSRAAHNPACRRPLPPRQNASRCLSVDSPRMNSSGKIVFQQGLERSCSSPCSLHAVARSYSSGVRVAPVVLNVPVCSRPVFGFFKDKKESAASKDVAATRSGGGCSSGLW